MTASPGVSVIAPLLRCLVLSFALGLGLFSGGGRAASYVYGFF